LRWKFEEETNSEEEMEIRRRNKLRGREGAR
jgi:hypothetical protein